MTITIGRRELIAVLGGAVAWSHAAHAQQPKVPTIGALVIGNISPEEFWREFRQGLRDLGYIEGENVRFEFRSAEGHIDRLPELAAELVRLKVDVIVTWFTPTAVAAAKATQEIPIVMAETGDPIGTGLVKSLSQPGGNVTGMAAVTAELAGKSVQLIRDMLPSARRGSPRWPTRPIQSPNLSSNRSSLAVKPPEPRSNLSGLATMKSSRALSPRWTETGPTPSSFSLAYRAGALPSWRCNTACRPFQCRAGSSTKAG
jgi:ABC transporter substrate binding protein